MSFGRLVTLSVLTAFSAGAGYSYVADNKQAPAEDVQERVVTETGAIIETVGPSVQLIKTSAKATGSMAYEPYSLCSGAIRRHCVVDGDTIWHQGTKIRIADIDTAEVSEPRCSSEAALGAKATKRLLQLVNLGPFELQSWPGRDEDKYGRKLRVLVRDGRSLGDILVSEGLARTWNGRRQTWC